MIISHEKKFVFIRGYRNAGVSVKAALSVMCGNNDIISEYNPAERSLIASKGLRQDQNNRRKSGGILIPFNDQLTLSRAYDLFPGIENYDVIGICRCPYDRAYSLAKWNINKIRYRSGLANMPATSEMIRTKLRELFQEYEGRCFCDAEIFHDSRSTGNLTILRYENLHEELLSVFAKYSQKMPDLLKIRGTNDVCPLPWQEVFGRSEIDLINKMMKRHFELFGYEMQ